MSRKATKNSKAAGENFRNHLKRTYIGLLHHPVYNKNAEIISSAVTNLDIHDIARLSKTYDLAGYFIITPDEEQQQIAKKICMHWTEGSGASYNPERKKALNEVIISPSLEDTVKRIDNNHGTIPKIFATTASAKKERAAPVISYSEAANILQTNEAPAIIIFGTAWGLTEETLDGADYLLEPIYGQAGYNHLSVRTAVAIIVDRLSRNSYHDGLVNDLED